MDAGSASDLLASAEQALALMQRQGFDHAQVSVSRHQRHELCVAHNEASLLRSALSGKLQLAGLLDGRRADIEGSDLDAQSLQALVLGLLPRLIYSFDPQGLSGLMLSVPIFFVAGIVLGIVSPGKTFVEPAAGSMLAAGPTLALVAMRTPEGFEPTVLAYIVCAVMGVMMALFGAFVGEKVQMLGRPIPTAKKRA